MMAELINHVWQSTVFAVLVGLLTIVFRKNRAHVRYWLWLSASFKFLLPFALLMTIGNRLERHPATGNIAATPAVRLAVMQMSQPFPEKLPRAPSTREARDWAAVTIFCVWVCGFTAIGLIRLQGWRRIRAAVRSSTPIELIGTMQVRSSPLEAGGLLEPGVVGFFRPILLLPAGIAERLQPLQLEAVLAHELCHARRRDNLTSAIHMIVEVIFWFHPLVWWIGARLIEERERACDEAVLSLGNAPRDYAEGILKVCKSYLESPLSCVPGVTGSDLKKRIQAILTGHIARNLTFAKKLILGAAGIAALGAPILIGIINAPSIRAQSQRAARKFEAASIKPCPAFRKGTFSMYSPGQDFHSECTTVERFIQQAYGLFANGRWNPGSSLTVAGGPAWTRSELYEINAKAADPQPRATMNGPMLQALLEDRLKLRFHRETREVPVYALMIAEGGPKLQPFQGSCTSRDFDSQPSEADCGTVRAYGNGFDMKAGTIGQLCTAFSVLLDRSVIDETGITGRFNMHVDLSGEDPRLLNRPRSLPAVSDPTKPAPPAVPFNAVKTAMKKLGLNVDPAKGPGEVLVIDHIARPSGN